MADDPRMKAVTCCQHCRGALTQLELSSHLLQRFFHERQRQSPCCIVTYQASQGRTQGLKYQARMWERVMDSPTERRCHYEPFIPQQGSQISPQPTSPLHHLHAPWFYTILWLPSASPSFADPASLPAEGYGGRSLRSF